MREYSVPSRLASASSLLYRSSLRYFPALKAPLQLVSDEVTAQANEEENKFQKDIRIHGRERKKEREKEREGGSPPRDYQVHRINRP
jgi:hypothetical protein